MPDFSSLDNSRLLTAEDGLHAMFAKAIDSGANTENIVITHEELTEELRKRKLFYEPLAKAGGHAFTPVRNVCRTCRQPGPPAHDGADHAFVPVRNVCRGCGQGQAVHKATTAPDTAALMQKAIDADPVCKALGATVSPFTKSRIVADPVIKAIYSATTVEAIEKALPKLPVEQRQVMAQTGIALPNGSFPIPDEAHLHAAIRLVGQAQDPQAAMNHIIERAKAMGMEDALPPAWQVDPNAANQTSAVGPGAHALQPGGKAQPQRAPMAGGGGNAASGGGATSSKPGVMNKFAKAVAAAMGAGFDAETFLKEMSINLDPEFEYAIVKAKGESRYTLGPVYMPDTLDAHGEWATAEDLEKAAWEYFKAEDHDVYLQHSDQKAGELVALMPWPHEVEAVMQKSIDGVIKSVSTTFPAGTVYAGVLWEPWAWEAVKKQEITGFSMGGWARRLEGSPV